MRSKKEILDTSHSGHPDDFEANTRDATIEVMLDIRDLLHDAVHGPPRKRPAAAPRVAGPPPWRTPTSVKCVREVDLPMAIARAANLTSFMKALVEDQQRLTDDGLRDRLAKIGVEALEVFHALGLKIR